MNKKIYIQFISQLKQAILNSRYNAIKLVNKEQLLLYYEVGKLLNEKIINEGWGAKVLDNISTDLQLHFPGLRGFSRSNLANMKQFFCFYSQFELIQSATGQLQKNIQKKEFIQSATGQIFSDLAKVSKHSKSKNKVNLSPSFFDDFLSISFTHHTTILHKIKSVDEKIFYIQQSANNNWTVNILEYQIESNYFKKQNKLSNNFKKTLPKTIQNKAIQAFKSEYLMDFINISDPDNPDEREIEEGIIKNLRQFILSLGKEFSYMGNQYRITHDDIEYFIDLLFFHRGLKCLISVDIKRGKFIPEYAGKMNFYLSLLNKYIKLNDENPSIGIVLCKEKNDSTVEFSIADMNKPIGVSKYKLSNDVPKNLKKYLPSANELINVLNEPQAIYN